MLSPRQTLIQVILVVIRQLSPHPIIIRPSSSRTRVLPIICTRTLIPFLILIIPHNHPIVLKLVQILYPSAPSPSTWFSIIIIRIHIPLVFVFVILLVLLGVISSDIIPWDVRDTGAFDSGDDFGWRATDYSDCVEAGDVVDCGR